MLYVFIPLFVSFEYPIGRIDSICTDTIQLERSQYNVDYVYVYSRYTVINEAMGQYMDTL